MSRYFILIGVPLLILVNCKDQSWHTSQIVLKKLYQLQEKHFNIFLGYLASETERLEELKNNFDAIHEWRKNMSLKTDYLRNHVQAVQAMTWLRQKLLKVYDFMDNKKSLETTALKIIDEHISDNHIKQAYLGLRRLQMFYAIPASKMAAGISHQNDRIFGDHLNACECYVISEYCFKDHDMYGVLDWAVEAYKKWNVDGRPECVNIDKLHFYIVASSSFTGFRFDTIINLNNIKYSEKTEKMMKYYSLMSNELKTMHMEKTLKLFNLYNNFRAAYNLGYANFITLCRQGTSIRKFSSDLKCSYQTKDLYYRILMPFKVEDINDHPQIKIYHDVLYEKEIVEIKSVALKTMTDAKFRLSPTFQSILIETVRSGQVSWMEDKTGETLFKILNARIESFTGFSTESAEKYQLVNYGLSGHYGPHHDPFTKNMTNIETDIDVIAVQNNTERLIAGNKIFGSRMVTVLFYLTDVEDDGYTAYPLLGIISSAVKGSALVWHNTHMSNGSLHYESLHGACPILKGNKWIMTKWLREKGQNLPYDWQNF